MRRLLVIGIGAGDPEHVTVQAIRAMNSADVFFVVEKRGETAELERLREEVIARYVEPDRSFCTVALPDPRRDRGATAYEAAVDDWRGRRAEVWESALARELPDGGCGAFLVWGDPALYDSTIAVVDDIRSRGRVELEHEVVPGISSVQALAARHRAPLNRVGGAVQITTGRRLAAGFPDGVDDVVVMLDADCAFTRFADDEMEILWGAYVGTPDEILIAGRVGDVAADIVRTRREARERKGWVMDTYLLRRPRH
jgi:precorrin-6A synthase